MSSAPPDHLLLRGGQLARLLEQDGDDVAEAVRVSLSHLRPFMAWATEAVADAAAQRARGRDAQQLWDAGSDFTYVLRQDEAGPVVGMFGLQRRVGPAALEIGYWLHPGYLRRGYATNSVAVLTEVALGLPGVDRVEIHTDEVNTASAAIPARLGYRLDRVERKTPQAPSETERRQIWIMP